MHACACGGLGCCGRISMQDCLWCHEPRHPYGTAAALNLITTPMQAYVVCELPEKLNLLWAFIKSHLKVGDHCKISLWVPAMC